MTITRRIAAALLGAALMVDQAGAQTAAQDIEARRAQAEPRPGPLTPGPAIQFTSQRAPSNAADIRFTLRDFMVVGATKFDDAALARVYQDRLDREINLAEVYEVAGALQKLYRDADYVFTRVIVPAQEIEAGIVRLEIIEAFVETVTIEEPGEPIGAIRGLIERMVAPLQGADNPTGGFLERILLNINEIPGVFRATAVPTVGSSGRGALALAINVEWDPFEAVIYGDNRQTTGVGRGIIGATATLNSWSEYGDTTTIAVFNSFGYGSDGNGDDDGIGDLDERNTIQLEHTRYLTADGTRATARILYSRTRPGDDLAQVGIEGEQIQAAITIETPILRTRQASLTGYGGVEFLNSETDVSNGAFQVADDRLRVLFAGFEGVRRDSIGYTSFDVRVRQGLDILNAADPATDALLSRADGRGDFTLLTGSVERLIVWSEELSLLLKAGGQVAANPLLASEEFAIGGLTFGRGFDPSEFTGDDGFGVAAEWRYRTPVAIDEFVVTTEAYAFADYGMIWNKGQGQPDREDILSGGAGVRLFLPEQYVVGLEVGFPLDQPLARTASRSGRLFVNLSKQF